MIVGSFAAVLEANRALFNQQFADARHTAPDLDPDEFAEVLSTLVAPAVDAAAPAGGELALVVGTELYAIALDLCGQDRMTGAVRMAWEQLLPRVGPQVATAPRVVVASLTNAAANLDAAATARGAEWILKMFAVAEVGPDHDELLRAGQVAAWRAGLAAYREGALEVAGTLSPPVVEAVLGVGPNLVETLRSDPWFDPTIAGRRLAPVRVGSFRGLGGPFVRPPVVVLDGDDVVATDGEDWWLLFADAFGTATVRTGPPEGASSPAPDDAAAPAELAWVPEISSWVRGPAGLVVTSALAHAAIFVPEPT